VTFLWLPEVNKTSRRLAVCSIMAAGAVILNFIILDFGTAAILNF